MSEIAISLPVSIEQIAAAIVQMEPADQDRLLALAPSLRQRAALTAPQKVEEKTEAAAKVHAWVMDALDHKPLSSDAPFFDGLTLGEYLALPDDEQAELWDKWEGTPLYDMEEVWLEDSNISESQDKSDAVPA